MAGDAGRACPLAYRYRPETLCRSPEPAAAEVLYVIGGLYGNLEALDEIERMAAAERRAGRRVRLLFNGDFNWFNASDALFRAVNERVLAHTASLGNVEYELARPSPGAGCGCAYPDFVDAGVVARSNRIMARLQAVAARHPDLAQALSGLPRFRCLMFGGLKILLLHGDPESLAGWGLAREAFLAGNGVQVADWFRATGADAMVCTHTCLPVLWSGPVAGGERVVVNNGSAGMGNLSNDPRGLLVRMAAGEAGAPEALAGVSCRGVRFDLVPVAYDLPAWLSRFDALWPSGSEAERSYRPRLLTGTALTPEQLVFPAKVSWDCHSR
ncbi:hypothetical protein [uncultured Marinobacter sp.]|uniref:metallophosphoesterase family protein n=1 Tax=uncultured Marinobacter sp. TaxID=187379 RepID=UPI000C0B475F|nr:hypothetical protein [Marinobacter sp.]MBI43087.1 hypothetical protein [Oceanospirillales bacterium]